MHGSVGSSNTLFIALHPMICTHTLSSPAAQQHRLPKIAQHRLEGRRPRPRLRRHQACSRSRRCPFALREGLLVQTMRSACTSWRRTLLRRL